MPPSPALTIAVGTSVSPLTGLAKGRFGDDVVSLQEKLISAGFTPKGGADGYFGPATEAALKAYQEAEGLAVSGIADELTVAHLLNAGQEAHAEDLQIATAVRYHGAWAVPVLDLEY